MEEKLLDILAEVCDDDSVKTDLDGELFDSGLLDSLAFADLLFAIEDNFNVVIDRLRFSERILIHPIKLSL